MKSRKEKLLDMFYYGALVFGLGLVCGYIWAYKAIMGGGL